jgi:SAM-dependent methyltransferase
MTETLVTSTWLRVDDARVLDIDVRRWLAAADEVDEALLDRVVGPVLDVGCGPGRMVRALRSRGIAALGVEIAPTAVAVARRWGAPVVQCSIFGRIPRRGHWGSALLLDGSVGIGGDPIALLDRVAELLGPRGSVFMEMEAPAVASEALTVRIETANGIGPWFPWAVVSISDADELAAAAGFRITESWAHDERWFVRLDRAHVSGGRNEGTGETPHP